MNDYSFETLLYRITTNIISKIIEANNWSKDYAMERFFTSKLYSFLEKEETKIWQYNATMLVQLFNKERTGRLVFPEI